MSINETQENIHSQSTRSIFSHFWMRVIDPHPEVTEIGDRRRAQLLAGVSLILIVPLLLGIILRVLTNVPEEIFAPETFQLLGLVLFALLAYILSRTPYFQWGSISLVTAFSIGAINSIFSNNSVSTAFYFLIPAFVIASALLRAREITALVVINIAILFLVPVLSPTVEQSFSETGIVLTTGLLLIIVVIVRNLIERERLAEVETVNQELRSLQSSLEQRVASATSNLELAAEVSHRVSLVRDIDTMLSEAVEIIRERFDLYYTQIYLTDPTGRALVLRAGTGDVGQTLLDRGHRLAVDMGSLNGIAATERRAVIVEDTESSPLHRANPLLPDTRSEMVVPLIVGERVVGVLDMQSSQAGALSGENLVAFEALAGQLAISITNAALFAEIDQARTTVEEQTRRLTHEGWQDFMDAIERSERVAYTYDRENITPLPEPLPDVGDESTLVTPIRVSGAPVGKLQFKREMAWTEDDYAISNAVAHQVAQQIENLRLLAQSEQYQAEAQEALRRLTREGWEGYQGQFDLESGFVYQDHEVKPLAKSSGGFEEALTYQIKVREEPIGELAIAGIEALSADDAELVAAVNEQLSAHLENLRLSTQTEQALARTDELYGISQAMNEAETEAEILEALARPAAENGAITATLMYLESDAVGNPEWTEIVADWRPEGVESTIPIGTRFYLPEMPLSKLWMADPDNPLLISDVKTDERVDDVSRAIIEQAGSRALVITPLTRGRERIALLIFNWDQAHEFSQQEAETYQAIIGLASPAVQSRRLFEQTQTRAQREQALRQITAAVRASTDPTTIMRTAVRELGSMLGRKTSIRMNVSPSTASEAENES
jgi:GAF domain-containing protein